jgi:hypothetical protein
LKILMDNCVPRPFRRLLPGHEVKTAYQCGWGRLSNGALLAAAGAQFDLFLTTDQNLQFQQNLDALPISVLVLVTLSLDVDVIAECVPHLGRAFAIVQEAAAGGRRVLVRVSRAGII